MHESLLARARGALWGLAWGDAVGFPAMYHRALALQWGHELLWEFSRQAAIQHVNKISLPFTLSQGEEPLHLGPTDDTEWAALAALVLLNSPNPPSDEDLFAGWQALVMDHADTVWGGVAERVAISNIRKGLRPPATGNDNPHHYDDGAVARSVPVGIRYAGDPDRAAVIAGKLAAITHADEGIFAAQAMAAAMAEAMNGGTVANVLASGARFVPAASWLDTKIRQARDILHRCGSGLSAVPEWNDHVANQIYNYGNVAPETLAVAFAIVEASDGDLPVGIQLAGLIPKQADTMPAMVGALAGAIGGEDAVPPIWQRRLDRLRGVSIPHVAGMSLQDIAERLVTDKVDGW